MGPRLGRDRGDVDAQANPFDRLESLQRLPGQARPPTTTVGQSMNLGGGDLNQPLEQASLARRSADGQPEGLENLVALPPVATIEKIDPVKIEIRIVPVLLGDRRGGGLRPPLRMPVGVSPGMRRTTREVTVGREGTRRVAREVVEGTHQGRGKPGHPGKRFEKVRRERRLDPPALPGERILDLDPPGVQRQSMQSVRLPEIAVDPPFPIGRVPDELVAQPGEVTSDLMTATGDRHRGHEGVPLGHDTETSECRPARLTHPPLSIGQQPIDEKTFGEKPPGQPEIGLPRFRSRKGGLQQPGRLRVESEENHAGGRSIDSMDPVDPTTELGPKAADQYVAIGSQGTAMDEEAGGLGDRDEASILI